MRFLRSRRGLVAISLALLLGLFLIRPGVGRLRTRIAGSISLAVGRTVEIGSVSLRLLPQPGFDLGNFVVYDDPSFSAEPMLQAQEVTAVLRVRSLLRGRLEIARLSLSGPSLNLVRDSEGRWNLESLLERAALTPVAPTNKDKAEARPAFPYIEADRGRINLKVGPEKKPYALTEAEFGLWQDSENAWAMRLKAQLVRTDFNLNDTGLLRVNGTWQRASSLRQTPLQFSIQWENAQLGQVSKLAYGKDKAWRGELRFNATLAGTPADLRITTNASVQDFRRYDISGGDALQLTAHCSSHYSTVNRILSEIACQAPVGQGSVTLDGAVAGLRGARSYDLTLIARDVPMQALVALTRRAKKDLPDDLMASGKLDGHARLQRNDSNGVLTWNGGGETSGFRLESKLTDTSLNLEHIPFAISLGAGPKGKPRPNAAQPVLEPHLNFGPFALVLGKTTPATMGGWVSRSGYSFGVQGDAQVQKLLQVARTIGLRAPQPAADGAARIDLQIAGSWTGFAPSIAVGKAQLKAVRAELRGVNAPLEIASANLLLTRDEVSVRDVTASFAGSTWHGSLNIPRPCVSPDSCAVRFNLHADLIATDELSGVLNPRPGKRPWYRFLSPGSQPGSPYLLALRAAGKLTADRVRVHKLAGTHVSASVELDAGRLRLSDLRGEIFGGKHVGEWRADFTLRPPVYNGNGMVEGVSLAQLAEAMRNGWITGTAMATYRATASGLNSAELLASARATLQVDAHEGSLPHVALTGIAGPLRLNRVKARLLLENGKFEFQESKLETPSGIYQVSGSASLGQTLDVKLMRDGAPGFNIRGTLAAPRVTPAPTPETQVALKP